MNKRKRAKLIDEAIRLTWSSLESHLKWTHGKLSKAYKADGESHEFHQEAVKDYAKVIHTLSKLY